MRRWRGRMRALVGMAWVTAVSGCTTMAKYNALAEQNQKLRDESDQQQRELQARVDDLQQQLDKSNAALQTAQKERDSALASNQQLMTAVKARSGELSRMVARLTTDKQALEKQLSELQRTAGELQVKTERDAVRVKAIYERLVSDLQPEIKAGEVAIQHMKGKLRISVAEGFVFPPGRTDVRPSGEDVLGRVAKIFNDIPEKNIRIEGFTDNTPVAEGLREIYATNWDLGAARALNVVQFLQGVAGVDPLRLSATSFGEYRPVASNTTPEGQAKNRHIEIALVDPDVDRPMIPSLVTLPKPPPEPAAAK